jgi:hypothetical protein
MNAPLKPGVTAVDVSTCQRRHLTRRGVEYSTVRATDMATDVYLTEQCDAGRSLEVHAALAQRLARKIHGLETCVKAVRSTPGGYVFHLELQWGPPVPFGEVGL